jgi:nucleoside-diphosphate-sugar epimerase
MQRILITGALGFLGRQCTKEFNMNGYEVITTDKANGANLVGDLTDRAFVRSLPSVDAVVNCAAVQYVTRNKPLFRKNYFYNNNVISTKLLSEKYRNTAHFVHVGTSMMYQEKGGDYNETSVLGGNGIYSQSKYEAQKYVSNLETSATIIPCIIGGIGREGLFKPFVSMIKWSPVVVIPGQGETPIHMVHVEDVAKLITLIVAKRSTGLYNAASPKPLSIRDWIEVISTRVGRHRPKIVSVPISSISLLSAMMGYRLLAREQVLMLKSKHVLSIDKSLALGWQPTYSNYEIATQISDYFQKS